LWRYRKQQAVVQLQKGTDSAVLCSFGSWL
jgi:hypothetical protein